LTSFIMLLKHTYGRKYAAWTASLLAASSLALSPILFPAFAADVETHYRPLISSFTPAGVDVRLARKFEIKAQTFSNSRFPFTPAGVSMSRNRTMTVAARADSALSANAVSVRNILVGIEPGTAPLARLNPSNYSLSAARGWQGFALPKTQKLSPPAPISDLVGRSNFRLDEKAKAPASRFNTNVKLDQIRDAAPSPRGNAASGEYKVDVGTSFSITRKLAVTAGVRYNSERDRVLPQVSNAQDSEAVYVGTKIRF
jgi:hypothetical protein